MTTEYNSFVSSFYFSNYYCKLMIKKIVFIIEYNFENKYYTINHTSSSCYLRYVFCYVELCTALVILVLFLNGNLRILLVLLLLLLVDKQLRPTTVAAFNSQQEIKDMAVVRLAFKRIREAFVFDFFFNVNLTIFVTKQHFYRRTSGSKIVYKNQAYKTPTITGKTMECNLLKDNCVHGSFF